MKEGIKLELYRAFHSRTYVFALVIACLIAIAQVIAEAVPLIGGYAGEADNITYPPSLYNTCLMLNFAGFYGYLYYYASILLGTIAYGISYYTDLRGGYIKNLYTRMNRNGYLAGKYLAVFLSAGSICVIPLVLNLYLTALLIPALIPQPGTRQFAIVAQAMFSDIFYSHPMVYIGIYLLIDFFIAGLFACMALTVSRLLYNRYVLYFFPFILFILLQTILGYTKWNAAGPYAIMQPVQPDLENFGVVVIEIVVLFVVSVGGYVLGGGRKHEAL